MAEPQGAGPQRILIVRPSALGDIARTVPALVTLRRAFATARIEWLVNRPFAEAIRHHPMLDGVVPFERRNWLRSLALMRELGNRRYDRVYDLQGLARSGALTWATRAPVRVGFANAREAGWLGCNRRHRIDPGLHTVDRMLALLEAEGHAAQRDLRLYVGDDDADWARTVTAGEPYACLAPTAAWLSKCWPLDRYTQIGRRLLDRLSRLVVLASPAERATVAPMLDALGDRAVCPATGVGQMMALIAASRLVVCNDSAALHIAVGLDRPVVGIFGPTDPRLVGPYPYRPDDPRVVMPTQPVANRSYRRIHDQTLIATVPVDVVWERIQRLLA